MGYGVIGNAGYSVIPQPYKSWIGYVSLVLFGLSTLFIVGTLLAPHISALRTGVGLRPESLEPVRSIADKIMIPAAVGAWIGVLDLFGPTVLGYCLAALVGVGLVAFVWSGLRRGGKPSPGPGDASTST